MRALFFVLTLAAAPHAGVAAQTAPVAPASAAYDPAPWWMREPVIASPGLVRAEVRANRAGFAASFQAVDRTAADAVRQAGERVRVLAGRLAEFGADKVRVETGFAVRPIYAQYKDKDGQLRTDAREDRIDRYAASATVRVEVRDVRLAERAYALTVAARPTSVEAVEFSLQPENAVDDALFAEAVKDAARRARVSAADAGARLGPVRLIDPTGRACQQDELVARAPRSYGAPGEATDVSGAIAPPPPPPPLPLPPVSSAGIDAAVVLLPLQPPLRTVTREACVIYALAPG